VERHLETEYPVASAQHSLGKGGEMFFDIESLGVLYAMVYVGYFFAFGDKFRVSVACGLLHPEEPEFSRVNITAPVENDEFHREHGEENKYHAESRRVGGKRRSGGARGSFREAAGAARRAGRYVPVFVTACVTLLSTGGPDAVITRGIAPQGFVFYGFFPHFIFPFLPLQCYDKKLKAKIKGGKRYGG